MILGEAEEEFRAFVEKRVLAAWTILGVSAIETAHPLNVGMVDAWELWTKSTHQ